MAKIFELVKFNVSGTPSTDSVTVGTRNGTGFFLPAEAGAVDTDDVFYVVQDGSDKEVGYCASLASTATVMSRDVVSHSIISGVVGTTKLDLSSAAVVSFVTPAEAFRQMRGVRSVTGTSDAIANGDGNSMISYSNASAIAVSIAQAGNAGAFLKSWFTYLKNTGAGAVTVTPATSTIEGASTFVLKQRQAAMIYSDGTNYGVVVFRNDLGTAAVLDTGTGAGNVPVLDGSGLLDTAVLPALAITDTNVVASQSAMLALDAQKGDIAIRSDLNKSFVLASNSPSTLADWKELLTPTDAVLSVVGLTGTVSKSGLLSALNVSDGADATGASIHAATGKTTPVDADELPIIDSAASNVLKKLTWANLKATLKTTAANIWAGTNDTLFLTAKNAADSNGFVTLTSSTAIATDASIGYNFFIPLAHNTTLGAPTNLIDGRTYQWLIQQDGTGSRTGAFNAIFEFGATTPSLSTAAGTRDLVVGTYHAASTKIIASFRKGS